MTAGDREEQRAATRPPAVEVGFRREPPAGPLPPSDPVLVERLREEIGREGPITFARFMAVALHDPERGYYAAPTGRPGRAGDFLTAPESHPIFGWTLARAAEEVWRLLGEPPGFDLVEHGAGSGALGLAILDGLRRAGSPLLPALRYTPVESAPPRLAELRERLAAAGFGAQLAATPPVTATVTAPVTGLVLANELLDALPVHRVTMRDGRLRELLVDLAPEPDGGAPEEPEPVRFAEVAAEPTTPALAARLATEGIALAEGQVAEICLALDDWVAGVAARLGRGIVLAIDYGHEAAELYGPTRAEGTLRTYLRHMVGRDPFRYIGRQDLTAHVDLTALVRAGARHGLDHLGTTSQAAFLVGSGIGELLAAVQADPATTLPDYLALRAALGRLLDPAASGGFRVVALGRGLPAGASLGGLRAPRP